MINRINIKNYGPILDMEWGDLGSINLIIGRNGKGKSIALKALFSALKTMEEVNRGDDNRTISDVLSDKLYWTFQTNGAGLGSLVNDENNGHLSFAMEENEKRFSYEFGPDTKKKVVKVDSTFDAPRMNTTVFIPPKEVLSLYQIVLKTRESDRIFGFDDTEYSLVKSMQYPGNVNEHSKEISNVMEQIRLFDDGELEYDNLSDRWVFVSDGKRIPIGILSEGVRKMSVIEKLLSNNYISTNSIVLIDEIETSLHPQALIAFLKMICNLSKCGIQFFVSTHSYICVKELCLLAREENISIPAISFNEDKSISYSNLLNAMPENDIIDAAREIYERELDYILGGEDD